MRATVLVLAVMTGCGSESGGRPCAEDADCLQGGVAGSCRMSTRSETRWCAFPDPECPGGNRWGVLAGDGLARMCMDVTGDGGVPDGSIDFALGVTKTGNGDGVVVSTPQGIDCGSICTFTFPSGTTAVLTAAADPASVFLGWTGDCSGIMPCELALNADRAVGATDSGAPLTVDANPLGDVVIGGMFRGTLMLAGTTLTSANPATEDMFIAKYASDGTLRWAKRFGSDQPDAVTAARVLADGSVIAAGTFTGTVDFGGFPLTSANPLFQDIFVIRLATDGTVVWAKRAGNANPEFVRGLAVDAFGDAFITGNFAGSVDFGGIPITANGMFPDVFVVSMDGADGHTQWAIPLGGSEQDYGWGVATDPAGDVVVTGAFSGTADLGGPPLTSAGLWDVYVAKYAGSDGSYLWS